MRKIRDVLRLTASGLSSRKVAASLSIGRDGDRLPAACPRRRRFLAAAGRHTDEILAARLYPAATAIAAMSSRRPQPDWAAVHRELRPTRSDSAALQLLWEEHRAAHPDGYGYIAAIANSAAPEQWHSTPRYPHHAQAKPLDIDRNR